MKPLFHNHRNFERNPFLGERFRVFKDEAPRGPRAGEKYLDQDEDVAKYLVNDKFLYSIEKEQTELVKKIEYFSPGKTKYTDPRQKADIEARWTAAVTELNGVDTLVQHFVGLKNRVSQPDYQPESKRWKDRMERITKSFKGVLEIDGLDPETKAKLQAQLQNEIRLERGNIQEDLDKIIAILVEGRNTVFKKLNEQLKEDFKARMEYLKEQWATKTPEGYEGSKDGFISQISDVQNRLDKLPTLEDTNPSFKDGQRILDEYQRVWDDLDRFEDKYLFATELEEDEFDIRALEEEFKKAEATKRKDIDPMASQYKQLADQVVRELGGLIAEIKNLDDDLMPPQMKEDEIKGLQHTLDKVKEGRDIAQLSYDALYSKDLWQKEDPKNPTEKIDIVNEEFPLRKGLQYQLEMIKDQRFNKLEQKALGLGLHEALEQFQKDSEELKANLQVKLPDLLEKIRLKREGIKQNDPGGGWKMRLMAPYDAYRAYEIVKEWAVRRYKRSATERVGEFGSNLLKPLTGAPWPLVPLRTLPNEFDKEVEKAEQEEVNQYKEIYANKDMWQIEDVAMKTKSKDELKACLYLLAEGGRLRWDKVDLVKQLNRFQNYIYIPEDKAQNLADISLFYERLRKACGYIWDFDTFTELKNKNSSSYDSKKKEFEQNCHEWAESVGTLSVVIEGLLRRHKEGGDAAKVDPILYEEIVEYTITYGKMSPEDKLYYLIQGIATGLLPPDRGSVLCSVHINNYPAIDYFGSSTERGPKPTLQDIYEVAALDRDAFNTWFHNVAMTMHRVTQRVDKALTQGKELDHDDLTCYLAYMSATTTENVLQEHSGRFILPATGVQNATIGMLHYMDNMSEHFERMPRNKEQLRRFIDSVTRFQGVTKNYMYKNKKGYYRWDVNMENSAPRSESNYASMYGRSGATCKQNMDLLGRYFAELDQEFFGRLFQGKIKDDDEAKAIAVQMKERYGEGVFGEIEVKEVDDLYKAAGTVAGYFIENEPRKVERMFAKVKADHQRAWQKMKKDDPKAILIRQREKAGRANIQELRKFYDQSQGGSANLAAQKMRGGPENFSSGRYRWATDPRSISDNGLKT